MTTYGITGVSGYLGRLLAHRLAADPDTRVVGLDLRPPVAGPAGLAFRPCDIRDPGFAQILREEKIGTLIHLAFYTLPEGDARLAESVNLDGTRNVLQAAGAAGIRRLVLASSAAAYGSHPDNPVPLREEQPLRPNPEFPYSWHKAEQERMTREFLRAHPRVETVILRPCALIGPHINNPTGASLRQKFLLYIKGDTTPLQFIHEQDAAAAFALAARGGGTGVFNVAPEGTLTYAEIARLLHKPLLRLPYGLLAALATLGHRLRVSPVSARTLAFIRHPIIVDASRFRHSFAFQPRYTVHDALVEFTQSHQRSPPP